MSNGIQLFSKNNFTLNQVSPSKLLKKYLECKNSIESEGLQGQIEKVVLKEMKNHLYSLYKEKRLSNYHFVRMLLNSNEQINKDDISLITAIGIFKDEFLRYSHDHKMQKQAENIAKWVVGKSELENFAESKMKSREGKLQVINPYLWAFSIPYFAPIFSSEGPYQSLLTEKTILLIDQFIKTERLPKLSEKVLIDLVKETAGLDYDSFRKALEESLAQSISHENVLSYALLGLEYNLESLLLNCSEYITRSNCGIKSLDIKEGKIAIREWNENVEGILKTLKDSFTDVEFPESSFITKALNKNITFPNALNCTILKASSPMIELSKISQAMPKAKNWKLHALLYLTAKEKVISSLFNVEFLQLIGECPNIPIEFPPQLKILIRSSKTFSIEERKNCLICNLGPIQNRALDLAVFGDRITEELFLEIVRSNPDLEGFEISSSCISDKAARFAIKNLPKLNWIFLPKSKLSEETVKFIAEQKAELHGLKIACDYLSRATLDLLSKNYPELFDLSLYQYEFNENEIEYIILIFNKLQLLELDKSKYSENLITKIFAQYPNIEKLTLEGLSFDKEEGELTIQGTPLNLRILENFIDKFNSRCKIKKLSLPQFYLSVDLMKKIIEKSSDLKIINLKNSSLSDELIEKLIRRAGELQALNLLNSRISQKGFEGILQKINLQELLVLVIDCSKISDETLEDLSKKSPKLCGIKLNNFQGDENKLLTLVSNLNNLKSFEIMNSEITSEVIEKLKRLRPNCKFVFPQKETKRLKLELID